MKKSAYNLNSTVISIFIALALMAYELDLEPISYFFTICAAVFLLILPNCSKTC